MKIIALLPFKNEEWILKEYINSIKKITDFIIAFDDNSTDKSRSLLEKAGAKIITENYEKESGWTEYKIRERLLDEGRKEGGTHFICLDCDEIFSNNFFNSARETILSLKPGQSLWMDWINLYGNLKTERIDGVYDKLNKSFIFCDDKNAAFKYVFLGVSRTPGNPDYKLVIDRKHGSVIHFQFLNTERSAMKRAWYMCSELIKADRSAQRINVTYDIQKDIKNIKTRPILSDSDFKITDNSVTRYDYKTDWRFTEIFNWFDKYGIEFFEPLDIWDNKTFKNEFEKRTGGIPVPKIVSRWIIKLNDIKNKIKNFRL